MYERHKLKDIVRNSPFSLELVEYIMDCCCTVGEVDENVLGNLFEE